MPKHHKHETQSDKINGHFSQKHEAENNKSQEQEFEQKPINDGGEETFKLCYCIVIDQNPTHIFFCDNSFQVNRKFYANHGEIVIVVAIISKQ